LISKEDIDKIFETTQIEEVVADYVTLKKRGVNLIGLCPFHDEKTPSFYVSPAKGIYKCFGCGKGGHAVNFVMEKEAVSYPDALRLLAKKYNIEITEEEQSPEQHQLQGERESLFVVLSVAQKYFSENLFTTDEGKSIGWSYFKERGFKEDIVQKFQLGYSFNQRTNFTDYALKNGYKLEYLVKAGLTIQYESQTGSTQGTAVSNINDDLTPTSSSSSGKLGGAYADRFWGRVMFPIHNATGRVIGFGGRTLRTDKKTAKYVNSPETEVYHKSDVLYGLYFAKKEIINQDNCFLVEGYTDVISLHQAGIENVVSSSGTSLTVGQIKLIRRFTNNITILYDGDSAGIKASFRGIDLILEEGLNVKVLLFPDGEDPDSYSKRISNEELKTFIKNNTKDFISFKTNLLMREVQNDPIKKAELIKDIVESIALIPDAIHRSVYVKECSRIMDMEERILLTELNKIRSKKFNEKRNYIAPENETTGRENDSIAEDKKPESLIDTDPQERKIIELLINHGDKKIIVDSDEKDERAKFIEIETSVADLIVAEMRAADEDMKLHNPLYNEIYEEYVKLLESETVPGANHFLNHTNPKISALTVDLISTQYALSNWENKGIYITKEEDDLKKTVQRTVYTLASKRLETMIHDLEKQIKETEKDDEVIQLLQVKMQLDKHKKDINFYLGRIVIK
jgi:DNA primase